jgi:hypothetical protein
MLAPTICSPFEDAWQKASPGRRVFTRRTQAIDPSASLLHAPAEYVDEDIGEVKDIMPEESDILERFENFVRGEYGTKSESRGDCPEEINHSSPSETSLEVANRYLEVCEDLVYGGLVDALIAGAGKSMGHQIHAVLADPRIGNKENLNNFPKEQFSPIVERLNQNKARLQFVIPGFPFKDQNIFRTQAPASHVDLGELGTLIRMHVLVLAIYQSHPYGADWIIITDGTAYARIFGVGVEKAKHYKSHLIELRNRLNLHRTISIIDLDDLANRLVSKDHGNLIFETTTKFIQQVLRNSIANGNNELRELFSVLVRGIKWNSNFQHFFREYSVPWKDAWILVAEPDVNQVPKHLKKDWLEIDDMASKASIYYAAYNIALQYHDALKRFLPDSVRATSHPKEGQIAAPSLGKSIAPWNGVCALVDGPFSPKSLKVVDLYRLQQKFSNCTPCFMRGAAAPLYYSVETTRKTN